MKVNIGPYQSDLVTFRNLERKYEAYRAKKLGIPFFEYEPVTKLDKAFEATAYFLESLFRPVNRFWSSRKRKISVQIHDYDVWGADYTLALVITPVLKKLKEKKHGSPHVDPVDAPEEISDIHDRWEWALDEMIWAFEQHCNERWEDQYHHNNDQLDITFEPTSDTKYSKMVVNPQKDPNKPAYWTDNEGIAKHRARMENGRRLFAKYYEALWD
jgi:hypothetical protein